MQGDMRIVEQHLNKLCSQHDQLMSLLDIYDYLPNAKGLYSINRSIGNKIMAFEKQVNQIVADRYNSKMSQDSFIRNKEQLLNASLSEAEERIQEIKVKIASFKDVGKGIEQKKRQDSEAESDILRRKVRSILEKAQTDMTSMVAKQKVAMRTKANTQKPITSISQLMRQVMPDELFNLQKIEHDIQERRLQFKNPPLLDFCRFTYETLRHQIASLQMRLKDLALGKLNIQQQLESIAECKHGIQYRIVSLTRFCEEQLLLKYDQQHNQSLVRNQQLDVRRMLQDLERLMLHLKIVDELTSTSKSRGI